jgi:CII-binding regulator of phage lambda lysogenization HflD
MRDIREDLRARASQLETRISSENASFERAISQLKSTLDNNLAPLRAQLRLAHKLLQFAAWHDQVRADLAARIAVAEAAEMSIRKSIEIAR